MATTKPENRRERVVRILQVVDSLAAGGLERVAVELACGLHARGYESSLCVTREAGALEELLPEDLDVLWLRRRSRFDLSACWRLRKYVRKRGIEVVHAHGTSVFIAAIALACCETPVLIWHDHYGDLAGHWRNPLLYRFAALRINGVVPVSKQLEHWERAHLRSKRIAIRQIVNPVGEMRVRRSEISGKVHGLPGRRLVCVANFRRQKDHPTLVAAFSKTARRFPDSRLFLVGNACDEPYMQEVRNSIAGSPVASQIEMLGPCSDIPGLLEQMDVGVLSSRSEGLPLALLEYAAASLGVVATAVGDVPTIIENGRNGFLVSPGDRDELALALQNLLGDPVRRKSMAEDLNADVMARFGLDRVLRELTSFYADLISNNRSRRG